MKKTISEDDFRDAFKGTEYETEFSPAGIDLLYEYLIRYEAYIGQELELDLKYFCAKYVEYSQSEVDKLGSENIMVDEDGTALIIDGWEVVACDPDVESDDSGIIYICERRNTKK